MPRAAPAQLIVWASRGAGAIGLVSAILYLALIIGQDDTSQLPAALVFFALMAGAGLAAWFADRVQVVTGRRLTWLAFVIFFAIGVLSVFTIGVLFLIASVLSVIALSRRPSGIGSRPGERGTDDD